MADWTALASVATAAGTGLLAIATYSSTLSANRSARSAERALLEGLRPILVPSRFDDLRQKVHYTDGRWVPVEGGRAALEIADDAVYVVLSVRNAGRGLAVVHGWSLPDDRTSDHGDPAGFHRLTRDIYAPSGEVGFCQIALRDRSAAEFGRLVEAAGGREDIVVDILYGDAEGTQRVITRFLLSTLGSSDGWALSAGRHWNLDRPDPR